MSTLFSVADLREALTRNQQALTTGMLDNTHLQAIADRVEALVEGFCDRRLLDTGATAKNVFLMGDGTCYLNLYEQGAYPLISVSSVVIDGETIPQRPNSSSNGWRINAHYRRLGKVALVGYTATLDTDCTVTCRYGYVASSDTRTELVTAGTLTDIEAREQAVAVDALKAAALDWAVYLVQHYVPGAEQIEIGTVAMSFSEKQMPARVKLALSPYRRLISG